MNMYLLQWCRCKIFLQIRNRYRWCIQYLQAGMCLQCTDFPFFCQTSWSMSFMRHCLRVYLTNYLNWQNRWCIIAHTHTHVSFYSFPSLLFIPIDMGKPTFFLVLSKNDSNNSSMVAACLQALVVGVASWHILDFRFSKQAICGPTICTLWNNHSSCHKIIRNSVYKLVCKDFFHTSICALWQLTVCVVILIC